MVPPTDAELDDMLEGMEKEELLQMLDETYGDRIDLTAEAVVETGGADVAAEATSIIGEVAVRLAVAHHQ
jgi:hypothetical protein